MSAYRQRASIVKAAKGVLSVAVFCTGTVVHVATYLGYLLADGLSATVLHVMVLAVFGLALGHLLGEVPPSPGTPRIGGSVPWSVVSSGMPRWAIQLIKVTLAYAMLNFVIFSLALTSGARAERRGGEYVLANHGRVQRVVSKAEYEEYRLWELRGVSGHWLLFSLLPVLVFTVRRPANARD